MKKRLESAVEEYSMKQSTDKNWIERIQKLFKQARKDLYYPPIAKWEAAEIETIKVDLSGRKHKMLVGKGAVDDFSDEALLGILHHELNHWAKHPYDMKMIILEQAWLSEAPHKNILRNLYDDIVVNLDLVINKGLEQVAQAYRELPPSSRMDKLLRAFYSQLTELDFGAGDIEPDLEEKLNLLLTIDFLDLSRIRIKNNIRRFAEVVGDLPGDEITPPFTFFNLGDFRAEEILTAMEGIAREVTPREYEGIAAEVLKEFKDSMLELPKRRPLRKGISRGRKDLLQELQKPDISWYRSRARRYSISIKSLIKQGSLYPNQIIDFELDDSIETFSPVESYGKVLPSLAKKHELEEFERYGELWVPDAVIIMDSSGSMANPDELVSYAVLGAFAVARNYLDFGARVGVINFSNSNLTLLPTRDRHSIYEMLKTYQGHGTTLHIDDLAQYAAGLPAGTKDYILITDAGIENVDRVIDYFRTVEDRLTVIWIRGEGDFDEKFKENCERFIKQLPATVTFVEIAREQDIPRIAVGKMFGEVYAND